ncbi:MAG: transcription antitermination factor NusB [Treponemataceae bacterium]|nr:transcription antitermination factor NusB [Treponemataceae bacterium]
MNRHDSRLAAVQGMYSWDLSGQKDAAAAISFDWLENGGDDDLTFARHLLGGSLENIEQIDSLVKSHLAPNWEFSRLNRVALAILRISIFSILYQKEIESPIIIDEALEIAKSLGVEDNCKFINGVLDKVSKETRQ